ncbi:MAG: chemotaxis protein CheW [Planctomycetota bacterium]|jgi:purine-binding chemotaxis protein CheW|nr:chemotaxis protein CheW [Planctomycetota bacterium]
MSVSHSEGGSAHRLGMVTVEAGQVQLCTFRVHGRLFGVDILDVREVTTETRVSPIPHAAPTARGFVNIRGQIHLVLDLRRMMGYPDFEDVEASRLVIFKESTGPSFGMLVDSVADIQVVNEKDIVDRRRNDAPPPEGSERRGQRASLVRGVVMIDEGLILVLRAAELLERFEELGRP